MGLLYEDCSVVSQLPAAAHDDLFHFRNEIKTRVVFIIAMLFIHTFSLILQKILNNEIVYNIDYEDCTVFKIDYTPEMLYFKLFHEISMKSDNTYSVSALVHHAICEFIAHPPYKHESKIKFLYRLGQNPFYKAEQTNAIYDVFIKAQRHYRVLSRFVNKWRFMHTPLHNDSDLYLNPITPHPTNNIYILQNGKKYIFTAGNIINIANGALGHAPMFFAEPLVIKNPYNNIPFSKSALYNIYFFLKQSTFLMSNLYHMYFKCNFDLREFRDKHEYLLRDYALDAYIKNTPVSTLGRQVRAMLKKRRFKCTVHANFPNDQLVEIFRPYLRLYYISMYALEDQKQNNADYELSLRLNYFSNYNRLFGRKYYYHEFGTRKWTFNDKCPPFHKNVLSLCNHFQKSHTDLVEMNDFMHDYEVRPQMPLFQSRENEFYSSSEEEDEEEEIDDERPDSMRRSTSMTIIVGVQNDDDEEGEVDSDDDEEIIEGSDEDITDDSSDE
jgi:hypothetical protein